MRGKTLEKTANSVNTQYAKDKKALILKIPVPIEITSRGAVPKPSTVDFAGILDGGRFIAFDAKETQNKTSFPLSNIHLHQLDYLLRIEALGGIAFFLIHFTEVDADEAFMVSPSWIKTYWDEWEAGGKASIKYTEFLTDQKVKLKNYLDGYINTRL